MSEVQDLAGAEPIRAAQMGLYVRSKNAERPCPACGSKDWTMAPDVASADRWFVYLACDGCNAVRMFLRPPIVAWIRSNRSA